MLEVQPPQVGLMLDLKDQGVMGVGGRGKSSLFGLPAHVTINTKDSMAIQPQGRVSRSESFKLNKF